jgi:hypothetical protein
MSTMPDKKPQHAAKTAPAKTLKEKRAAKRGRARAGRDSSTST